MRALLLCFCLLAFNAHAQQLAHDLYESVTTIDVKVKDFYGREETGKVIITQFDPEDSGSCNSKNYAPMAEAASKEILAALDYAKQQPYVNPGRVLLVGQSVGGYSTVATAAKNPAGLIGAINFVGGSGCTSPGIPCQGNRLEDMYARFGKTTKVPMLWIYTENDQYFNPSHSKAWHAAFVKAGGNADFHLLPPFAKNGHTLFSKGVDIWSPIVAEFIGKLGFNAEPVKR